MIAFEYIFHTDKGRVLVQAQTEAEAWEALTNKKVRTARLVGKQVKS